MTFRTKVHPPERRIAGQCAGMATLSCSGRACFVPPEELTRSGIGKGMRTRTAGEAVGV